MSKLEDFDHPCKGVCSGWQQGFEKGTAKFEKVERALKVAIDCLEYYANPKQPGYVSAADKVLAAIDHELVNPLNTSTESVKSGG